MPNACAQRESARRRSDGAPCEILCIACALRVCVASLSSVPRAPPSRARRCVRRSARSSTSSSPGVHSPNQPTADSAPRSMRCPLVAGRALCRGCEANSL
eukprot:5629139-Pleurochrysis_carterae.AAC.1